ncbi:malonyl-CoA ACP transacylase [Fragilariopsis cylindrus CCMP1102]|uniref:Malonyl-CoA ACP transacylase n=1 Tax=Fragilariopsis cylindrus CCMP1102 TaxID=635003 RepID=A0A1E7FU71_9STRA|nr:malonyl-CoA ACP transacylase [Fragilariopsis cylindrus CCMP1102]|eukprot:OEU21657.1 malonyl-CoA ACP transacylase [Fragilariopsis cylindrus CCMP1102]
MVKLLVSSSAMILLALTSRLSSAFVPTTKSFSRRSLTKVAASDNDFDDFSAKCAVMFPGQGAQFVGMCSEVVKDVPAAKALFDEASEILGYDLLEVCTEGPKEKLDSTVVSQPAIFVASMAAVEKLKQDSGPEAVDEATCAMGLSLGEYSALCFAGALSFADGVKITKARGEAMQAASDAVDSGMVSVIGLDSGKVAELCEAASEKSGEKVQIANFLCKGNYAVSGASAACDTLAEIAKPEFKARMTVRLAVAGAFHTDFMAPAVSSLEDVLKEVEIKKPRIPVISNVDAKPHSDPETIKKLLATQVTSPVLWENTMDLMLSKDFEKAYELGPGKVVSGILKRFSKTAECTNISV